LIKLNFWCIYSIGSHSSHSQTLWIFLISISNLQTQGFTLLLSFIEGIMNLVIFWFICAASEAVDLAISQN
jgi:hypothetical protein